MINKWMLVILLAITLQVQAQQPDIFSTGGKGAHGWDVVALHRLQPIMGDSQYTTTWHDVKWLFSSQADLDTFQLAPDKYAPQYGGYCAFGASRGYKAPTEADTWSVVGDKLYFNYNKQVKAQWITNKEELIQKADANWKKMTSHD